MLFPPDMTEQLKPGDTPDRTNSYYEHQLETHLPVTDNDLIALEKKYKGKFNTLIGQVLQIAQVTTMDLTFSCARLGLFNVAPNEAAFQGVSSA